MKDLARRTDAEVSFDGVDISESLRKHLISLTYTDYEENETDDLQIEIEDRDDVWLCKWLNSAIQAAAVSSSGGWSIGDRVVVTGRPQFTSYGDGTPGTYVENYEGVITHLNLRSGVPYPINVDGRGWFSTDQATKAGAGSAIKGLSIQARIVKKNWLGNGKSQMLDCGKFELDSIEAGGPPASITIKGTALPFGSQIRQTKKSKAWEAYTLSRIAGEIAAHNGMAAMYESVNDPYYKRVEQVTMSDIAFLSKLCKDAAISLKVSGNMIVLFDQAAYESKPAVLTIKKGDGSYTKYKLRTGKADMEYAACRVSYVNPNNGKTIQGMAYSENYDAKDERNQILEITAKVNSIGEAEVLAQKMLRMKNKYEYTAIFTLPGNTILVSGVTVNLSGWGSWDGKYIVNQAKHSIGSSGYTTQIRLRHVLEGY